MSARRQCRALWPLALAVFLGACGSDGSPGVSLPNVALPSLGGGDEPYRPVPAAAGALPPPTGAPGIDRTARIATAGQTVPTVYMALEADPGRPVSIVFAIDGAGDQTPGNDPAIRLTPNRGECNPQELARYSFEGDDVRPIFGRLQAVRGVGPERMPEFMAVAVSRRMIERGLAAGPAETQPQNVCTRKLWERLVLAEAATQAEQPGQSGQ